MRQKLQWKNRSVTVTLSEHTKTQKDGIQKILMAQHAYEELE
jgi:hypothetical protein